MIGYLFLLFYAVVINARHFNGGTIRWIPTDPYDNSSTVEITIIQTYWWTYPLITCTNNVPISTPGRSNLNTNLSCVVDCTSDGGYSTHPVNILTDCISLSPSVGFLTSQRPVNISLTAGAHFYLAYVGSAWVALNYPTQNNLEWSIVTFIDLRMRPDGFINTPPVASVVSPQYVIVNRTAQIQIYVSDVNEGDDVRCRWATYTPGYRRRKRFNEEEHTDEELPHQAYRKVDENGGILVRNPRNMGCNGPMCVSFCRNGCDCTCPTCNGTNCNGTQCLQVPQCSLTTTTTTTTSTTTPETPGTLKSTSSYPIRQALDECGGICYPGSMPTGTTLSNCTLTFTGLVPNTWYAAAIQVEDFFNTTDTTPMSSVPVQFLIYVMPEPECSEEPIIIPLSDCLEVSIGVPRSFNLSVLNSCSINISNVTAIVVSQGITGMQVGNLTQSPTNSSLSAVTLLWTPQTDQNGSQELCLIAYTDEQVQSAEYCVTFTVITSLEVCKTTTTTSTSTTATTTTTQTTSTTTTTSTITTATTTSVTTTTTQTTTTTSTITTTSTVTTTTTTSVTTTSTASTSTTTSSTTTTTVANMAVVATTTVASSDDGISWGLIGGLLSLALPLALCTCCCLYRFLWSPEARRKRAEEDEDRWRYDHLTSSTGSMLQTTTSNITTNAPIEVPKKSYQVYDIRSPKNSPSSVCTAPENEGSILVTIYNNTNAKRANTNESFEMGNAWINPSNDKNAITQQTSLTDFSSSKISNMRAKTSENFNINRELSIQQTRSTFFSPSFNAFQSSSATMSDIGHDHSSSSRSFNFKDWTRLYLFGNKPDTGLPRIPRPS